MLFSSLKRYQKEAIVLLQTGTFLEYFDLMIYVHMAVVLNELFFPPAEPKIAAIIAAFSFCSTYVLRPLGALIFGYIGDNFGRKPTVMITTTIMACCCLAMANLPTYAEIGITAAITVSVLRILQGMSSMGEVMGAKVYITEITKPPVQYTMISTISLASSFGTMAALGVATFSTRIGLNWRLAFWFGVIIALVGMVARTKLRETPDFSDAKLKMKKALESSQEYGLGKAAELLKSTNKLFKEKPKKRDFIYYIAIFCSWPFIFYLGYIYFIPVLKSQCGYSAEDVVLHNFYLSFVQIFVAIVHAGLSYKFYPLFLAKLSAVAFIILLLLLPINLSQNVTNYQIFIFQSLLIASALTSPMQPISMKYFPVFCRFTSATLGYALARSSMYIIISFGLVFLTDWLGFYGLWIIGLPLIAFYLSAVYHFEKLEKIHDYFPQAYPWNLSQQQFQALRNNAYEKSPALGS